MLTDRDLSFAASHDYDRRKSPELTELRERVELAPDASLDGEIDGVFSTRRAIVRIHLKDGSVLKHRVLASYGSRLRPLGWDEMISKSHRILGWRCPAGAIDDFIALIRDLEAAKGMADIRDGIRALLREK